MSLKEIFKKHQRGFSLVQVLISSGIISGLLLVAMKMIKDQTRLGKSSSEDFEIIYLVDSIRSLLSDPKNCLESFENKPGDESFIETLFIKNEDGKVEPVYEIFKNSGQKYGQGNIGIKSFRLTTDNPEIHLVGGETELEITFDKQRNAIGERVEKRRILLHVSTNEQNQITRCYGLPGFENFKTIKPSDWVSLSEGDQYLPQAKLSLGGADTRGALNVVGSLKLGQVDRKCNSDLEGTLRFNKVNQQVEYCNGENSWQSIMPSAKRKPDFKTYTKKHNGDAPLVWSTPTKFKYCYLSKTKMDGGDCYTSPANKNEISSLWSMRVEHFRGQAVVCEFKCLP